LSVKVKGKIADQSRNLDIISKIETLAGLENLSNICRNSDFVMAARGDLALSLPWVELPSAVNAIASSAKENSVPWILATQAMEGLERFSIPTRAEICDLANWLSRGCRGVLLYYETCFGSKPLEAVKSTKTIINRWGIY
jgi:pyruvate kinase